MVVVATYVISLYHKFMSKTLADQYSFHWSQQSPVQVKFELLELLIDVGIAVLRPVAKANDVELYLGVELSATMEETGNVTLRVDGALVTVEIKVVVPRPKPAAT